MAKILREIEIVEDELDELQSAYLDAEDDAELMKLESKFMQLLMEATEIDGKDRVAANVTITNWTRE
jgi:Mor family transcriptional regulator